MHIKMIYNMFKKGKNRNYKGDWHLQVIHNYTKLINIY